MSNWIFRGLRQGILTTPYPFGPAQMEERYRGRVAANPDASPDALERGSSACLSAAIREHGSATAVDTERCFQCGECARVAPEAFVFSSDFELALVKASLVRRTVVAGGSVEAIGSALLSDAQNGYPLDQDRIDANGYVATDAHAIQNAFMKYLAPGHFVRIYEGP